MDTRGKIIGAEAAEAMARERPVDWVCGYFEPLLAEHARRLREVRQPGHVLIAMVADPPSPLLPARARAELVAALADVDFVVIGDGKAGDSGFRAAFIDRVIARHQGRPA